MYTGTAVAVKELDATFLKNDEMRRKFREEANSYLDLEHPGIVKLDDFIDLGNTQYLVMEYVEGSNLSDHLKKMTGPMPFHNAAVIISEVAEALHHAHREGHIHLDIKPSNIMLTQDFKVKLIDFGIAQKISTGSQAMIMGTPPYMSPEQIDGKGLTYASDIFSLGITLYEMVNGQLPFHYAQSKEELFKCIKTKPLPKISAHYNVDFPKEYRMMEIIRKATEKSPQQRFATCLEFKQSLEQFLND
jgi:serine/threonine-protein kinase